MFEAIFYEKKVVRQFFDGIFEEAIFYEEKLACQFFDGFTFRTFGGIF